MNAVPIAAFAYAFIVNEDGIVGVKGTFPWSWKSLSAEQVSEPVAHAASRVFCKERGVEEARKRRRTLMVDKGFFMGAAGSVTVFCVVVTTFPTLSLARKR